MAVRPPPAIERENAMRFDLNNARQRWSRLSALLVMALTLAASGLVWWQFERSHQLLRAQLLAQAEQRSRQLAEAMGGQVSLLIGSVDLALLQLREAWLADPGRFASQAGLVLGSLPPDLYSQVVVVNASGYAAFTAPESMPGFYAGDREHFKAHQVGGDRMIVSHVFVSRIDDAWVVTVSRPLLRGQRFEGIITVALHTDNLARRLASLRLSEMDSIALLNADGSFVARAQGNTQAMGKKSPADRPFLAPNAPPTGSYYRHVGSVDLTPRVYGWQRLDRHDLIVVVGLAEEVFMAPLTALVNHDRLQQAMLTLVILLSGGLVILLMLRDMRLQSELAHQQERSAQRHEVVDQLTNLPAVAKGPVETVLHVVTEAAARVLGTERVSVWLFSETPTQLVCRDLFFATAGDHTAGLILETEVCRDHLAALRTDKYVVVGDPCTDRRTASAAEAYWQPHGIKAVLSTAIEANDVLQGILSCEHIGVARTWSGEDIAFARQLTDQLALTLQNEQRRQMQSLMERQNVLQSILLRISTSFVNLPSEDYDQGVREALGLLGEFLAVNRAFLLAYDLAAGTGRKTHEWHAPENEPCTATEFPLDCPEWLAPQIRGETVVIADVVSETSGRLRDFLLELDVRSLVTLPLLGEDGCRGGFGFASMTRRTRFAAEDLSLLRLFGGLLVNLEDRRRATETLNETMLFMRESQVIAGVGGWKFHFDKGRLVWTEQVYRLLEYPTDRAPDPRQVYARAEERNAVIRDLRTAWDNGTPFSRECQMVTLSGRPFWAELRCMGRVSHPQGDFLAGTFQDISRRKADEAELLAHREHLEALVQVRTAELAEAKAAAEAANAAKSDFLSRMSHELRTPLNAILGFGQLLTMDCATLTAEQADSLQEIMRAGEHLLEMVNEVLDLARIESGRLELRLETVDVASVVTSCLAQVKPLARQRDIAIENAVPADTTVRADLVRLRQVLINLLSNAIKYNRDGGRIDISSQAAGDRLRITVRDTGCGIDRTEMPRLFQPFERIASPRDQIEGTGIGLALVKKLVDAMGGEVGAASELGVGSTFWFALPLTLSASDKGACAPAPGAALETPDVRGQVRQPVLYIANDAANLKQARKLLASRRDLALVGAPNVTLGLERAQRVRPALILLDLDLPGMDGLAALQRLRDEPDLRHIPVIAVIPETMVHEIAHHRAAGFVDCLNKPFAADPLLAAIDRHLQQPGPS